MKITDPGLLRYQLKNIREKKSKRFQRKLAEERLEESQMPRIDLLASWRKKVQVSQWLDGYGS